MYVKWATKTWFKVLKLHKKFPPSLEWQQKERKGSCNIRDVQICTYGSQEQNDGDSFY